MSSIRVKRIALIAIPVLIVLLVVVLLLFNHNNNIDLEGPIGELDANEANSAAFAQFYPAHWDSYMTNADNIEQPSHFEHKPYLKDIYAGFGFAAEYNEPRSHLYTIEDILKIDPARKKAGASCFTCKSTQVPAMMEKYGDDYYLMSFDDIKDEFTEPIGCLDCHDPKTMDLKISRPALKEALERQGRDLDKLSQQEMRSLVCAQCHVTYYFYPETKRITFPWDKGVKADNILEYYDELGYSEWVHPNSGAGLVKPRHAEYETFLESTHQSAGLSCADCHMPYTVVGNKKVSSHKWQSPLNNIEQSCMNCHRNNSDWLLDRVNTIQSQTKQSQDLAAAAVVNAIYEIEKAAQAANVNETKLAEARKLHREAQWYLDFIIVTNGYGFHNPTETLNNLNIAMDKGYKASQLAREARD
ncbi:MAG: ammonia-forming cytochrome c nitrite reductase subunit c552 [Syntrophomonadaceae bacterium]|nr:ammonia-forming cytochrome c nitrite reductase subunit c552 [Syntrophomonadaceae bacterium]